MLSELQQEIRQIDLEVHTLVGRIATVQRLIRPTSATPSARAWSKYERTLPHGTALRMQYNGHRYEGKILDGKWVVAAGTYSSPSAAASALAVTKEGKKTQLNGWTCWEVKIPGGQWKRLNQL